MTPEFEFWWGLLIENLFLYKVAICHYVIILASLSLWWRRGWHVGAEDQEVPWFMANPRLNFSIMIKLPVELGELCCIRIDLQIVDYLRGIKYFTALITRFYFNLIFMFSVSSCNSRFDNELYFLGGSRNWELVRLHKRHLFTNLSVLGFHWSMFDLFSLFQQKKLRSEWTDPKLNEDDKFLVNFLLKKQYLDEDKRWVLHLSCARVFNILCWTSKNTLNLPSGKHFNIWLKHWTIELLILNHALIALNFNIPPWILKPLSHRINHAGYSIVWLVASELVFLNRALVCI